MVYLFLADGFEEIEALCPLDLLRRAGVAVTTVGVGGKQICGSHGISVNVDTTADKAVKQLGKEKTDMVILPGGMPGTLNLKKDANVARFLDTAVQEGKYIAAICAAPSILGERGLLNGKNAICFPGFEKAMTGATISEYPVVKDGNIITAKGMGVALEFGLKLVAVLAGDAKAKELCTSVQAPASAETYCTGA